MKKSLTDILIEALVGKKIRLYKVLDKRYNEKGNEYFITDKGALEHPKKCEIINESHGTIQSLATQDCGYDGDNYEFIIVDDNGDVMHVNGLYSVTSIVEFLN